MKQIPLTKGKIALVDDADFEWLSQWRWCYNSRGYAARGQRVGPRILNKTKTVLMHREVLGISGEEFSDTNVDHKNRDRLDNRRENLRICTDADNRANSGRRSDNTSGYKGVFRKRTGWQAQVKKGGKSVFCKTFRTPEEAARAYDEVAKKLFGEFANLNFPE